MVNGDVRAVDARISGLVAAQHANVVHGCIRPLLKATKQIIRLEAGEGKVTCKRQKTKDKREREREREGEGERERENIRKQGEGEWEEGWVNWDSWVLVRASLLAVVLGWFERSKAKASRVHTCIESL